jgi:dTDP-4-amino-4,6-dideoxygalactose transaminase
VIRLTIPSIEEDDLNAAVEVLASGYLVQGQRVLAFEEAIAAYTGARYAVAVSNCTAALHLALLALHTAPGDFVLVTSYSWPATANVIELCGAQPVFVDVCPETFNMDENRLKETLSRLMENPELARRVRAILPVHTFGQMANMPEILEIANQHHIPVIEDAACAFGATLNGRQAGTWGSMGCFSFHPRKAITTGEGGVVITSDPAHAKTIRALRNHGLDPDAPFPDFIMPGYNYRMTEFQAAIGLTQIGKMDRIIAVRRYRAEQYTMNLKNQPGIQPPIKAPGSNPVYQSYVVLLPPERSSERMEIIRRLRESGVETTIGTWHMPLISYYARRYGYRPGDFPVTDNIFQRSLTLPLYEKMTDVEQSLVLQKLSEVIG